VVFGMKIFGKRSRPRGLSEKSSAQQAFAPDCLQLGFSKLVRQHRHL
jgi:hypothetical protein